MFRFEWNFSIGNGCICNFVPENKRIISVFERDLATTSTRNEQKKAHTVYWKSCLNREMKDLSYVTSISRTNEYILNQFQIAIKCSTKKILFSTSELQLIVC